MIVALLSKGREKVIAGGDMPIALDVMGGDRGPAEPIAGAVQSAREDGVQVLLVGRRAVIEAELSRHRDRPRGLEIVDAPDVVEMSEQPAQAVRAKPESSLVVGL